MSRITIRQVYGALVLCTTVENDSAYKRYLNIKNSYYMRNLLVSRTVVARGNQHPCAGFDDLSSFILLLTESRMFGTAA